MAACIAQQKKIQGMNLNVDGVIFLQLFQCATCNFFITVGEIRIAAFFSSH